jgi:hypothetical protein
MKKFLIFSFLGILLVSIILGAKFLNRPPSPSKVFSNKEKKSDHWLKESTSEIDDPKAGAILVDLFAKSDPQRPVDTLSQQPKANLVPNLIYALIEITPLEQARQVPETEVMRRVFRNDWYFRIFWHSPKSVSTADNQTLKPGTAIFWSEKELAYLFIQLKKNGSLTGKGFLIKISNENKYAKELIKIAKEAVGQ